MNRVVKSSNIINILIGPTGAGKSDIVTGVVERCPGLVDRIISDTTRLKRLEEKSGFYYFRTNDEFHKRREYVYEKDGDVMIEHNRYGGNMYGIMQSSIDTILEKTHAIKDLTEEGYQTLKDKGYNVRAIRIIPKAQMYNVRAADLSRAIDDEKRSRLPLIPDLTVENWFDDGKFGLEEAISHVVAFIKTLPPPNIYIVNQCSLSAI